MNTTNSQSATNKSEFQMDVIDHPSVSLWMKETAQRDPQGFLLLIGNNVEQFERLFGLATWKNNGNKGWTHGWKVYESNLTWNILTGPSGTIFRVKTTTPSDSYLNDPKVGVGIVTYLNTLLRTLAN